MTSTAELIAALRVSYAKTINPDYKHAADRLEQLERVAVAARALIEDEDGAGGLKNGQILRNALRALDGESNGG